MIFAFGPYELDTRVYELRRSGSGPQAIEPQVFDVLAYLVRHRDRVVSKEELLEKLWPGRFVSEATLTSRLKAARRVVGDSGKNQAVIRTAHGRGYRFVAPVEERAAAPTAVPGCGPADHLTRAAIGAERPPQPATGRLAGLEALPPAAGIAGREPDMFVGRQAELARLAAAMGRAASGVRQVVFVAGEAGAGKTTLVDVFLSRAAAAGPWRVVRGQCIEHRGSGEAFMPLLDALSRVCREPDGSRLVPVLKREAPGWLVQLPALLPEAEHAALVERTAGAGERMLREFGTLVERLAAEQPLLLVLEDLHWSDYATLEAIDMLARQPGAARLLLLGTYRPADAKAARHPMHAVSQELRVRGHCDVVALPLLMPRELDEYLTRRFPNAPFSTELAALLHARTSGNALFARHVVDAWIDRGFIRQAGELWSITAPTRAFETDVPESLQQLIERQVSDLDPERQRLLESAAVLGRTCTVAAIASALPAADEDVERELEALAREGRFLRADGAEPWGDGTLTARFAFTHDLVVDVLYARISAARRVRLHQQMGRALERAWGGREREHASELALHFQRSLDRERGPRYLRLAAEVALERSGYREAVSHLGAALQLVTEGPPGVERDRTTLALLCVRAPALIATRGYADPEVEENYLRARDLAERLGDTAALSQTLYGMANMYEYRGVYDLAERLAAERLLLDAGGAPVHAMESHELLTCSYLHQGKYRESVEHGRKAMATLGEDRPLEGGRLVLAVQAYGWMAGALYFAGYLDEARQHSAEAQRLAEASGDDLARASAAVQAAFLHYYCGDAGDVAPLAARGVAIARERRFPFHAACGRILLGWSRSLEGQREEAVQEIRAGIASCRAIGALMDLPVFLAILSDAQRRGGDPAQALDSLDEALAIVASGRSFFYEPELHRLRALLMHEMGEPRSAIAARLRRSRALAEAQGSPVLAARAAASLDQVQSARGPAGAPASARAARRTAGQTGTV